MGMLYVSGAGNAKYNGYYVEAGTYNNHTYWQSGDAYLFAGTVGNGQYAWVIHDELTDLDDPLAYAYHKPVFFSENDPAPIPAGTNWVAGSAAAPAPVVTADAADPSITYFRYWSERTDGWVSTLGHDTAQVRLAWGTDHGLPANYSFRLREGSTTIATFDSNADGTTIYLATGSHALTLEILDGDDTVVDSASLTVPVTEPEFDLDTASDWEGLSEDSGVHIHRLAGTLRYAASTHDSDDEVTLRLSLDGGTTYLSITADGTDSYGSGSGRWWDNGAATPQPQDYAEVQLVAEGELDVPDGITWSQPLPPDNHREATATLTIQLFDGSTEKDSLTTTITLIRDQEFWIEGPEWSTYRPDGRVPVGDLVGDVQPKSLCEGDQPQLTVAGDALRWRIVASSGADTSGLTVQVKRDGTTVYEADAVVNDYQYCPFTPPAQDSCSYQVILLRDGSEVAHSQTVTIEAATEQAYTVLGGVLDVFITGANQDRVAISGNLQVAVNETSYGYIESHNCPFGPADQHLPPFGAELLVPRTDDQAWMTHESWTSGWAQPPVSHWTDRVAPSPEPYISYVALDRAVLTTSDSSNWQRQQFLSQFDLESDAEWEVDPDTGIKTIEREQAIDIWQHIQPLTLNFEEDWPGRIIGSIRLRARWIPGDPADPDDLAPVPPDDSVAPLDIAVLSPRQGATIAGNFYIVTRPTGGTPGYSVSVVLDGNNIGSAAEPNFGDGFFRFGPIDSTTYTDGLHYVVVRVRDAKGDTTTKTVLFQIANNSEPSVPEDEQQPTTELSFTVQPPDGAVIGSPYKIFVFPRGGTPQYTASCAVTNGTASETASLDSPNAGAHFVFGPWTAAAGDTLTARITVKDADGNTVTQTFVWHVMDPDDNTPPPPQDPPDPVDPPDPSAPSQGSWPTPPTPPSPPSPPPSPPLPPPPVPGGRGGFSPPTAIDDNPPRIYLLAPNPGERVRQSVPVRVRVIDDVGLNMLYIAVNDDAPQHAIQLNGTDQTIERTVNVRSVTRAADDDDSATIKVWVYDTTGHSAALSVDVMLGDQDVPDGGLTSVAPAAADADIATDAARATAGIDVDTAVDNAPQVAVRHRRWTPTGTETFSDWHVGTDDWYLADADANTIELDVRPVVLGNGPTPAEVGPVPSLRWSPRGGPVIVDTTILNGISYGVSQDGALYILDNTLWRTLTDESPRGTQGVGIEAWGRQLIVACNSERAGHLYLADPDSGKVLSIAVTPQPIAAIATGYHECYAVLEDGTLLSWDENLQQRAVAQLTLQTGERITDLLAVPWPMALVTTDSTWRLVWVGGSTSSQSGRGIRAEWQPPAASRWGTGEIVVVHTGGLSVLLPAADDDHRRLLADWTVYRIDLPRLPRIPSLEYEPTSPVVSACHTPTPQHFAPVVLGGAETTLIVPGTKRSVDISDWLPDELRSSTAEIARIKFGGNPVYLSALRRGATEGRAVAVNAGFSVGGREMLALDWQGWIIQREFVAAENETLPQHIAETASHFYVVFESRDSEGGHLTHIDRYNRRMEHEQEYDISTAGAVRSATSNGYTVLLADDSYVYVLEADATPLFEHDLAEVRDIDAGPDAIWVCGLLSDSTPVVYKYDYDGTLTGSTTLGAAPWSLSWAPSAGVIAIALDGTPALVFYQESLEDALPMSQTVEQGTAPGQVAEHAHIALLLRDTDGTTHNLSLLVADDGYRLQQWDIRIHENQALLDDVRTVAAADVSDYLFIAKREWNVSTPTHTSDTDWRHNWGCVASAPVYDENTTWEMLPDVPEESGYESHYCTLNDADYVPERFVVCCTARHCTGSQKNDDDTWEDFELSQPASEGVLHAWWLSDGSLIVSVPPNDLYPEVTATSPGALYRMDDPEDNNPILLAETQFPYLEFTDVIATIDDDTLYVAALARRPDLRGRTLDNTMSNYHRWRVLPIDQAQTRESYTGSELHFVVDDSDLVMRAPHAYGLTVNAEGEATLATPLGIVELPDRQLWQHGLVFFRPVQAASQGEDYQCTAVACVEQDTRLARMQHYAVIAARRPLSPSRTRVMWSVDSALPVTAGNNGQSIVADGATLPTNLPLLLTDGSRTVACFACTEDGNQVDIPLGTGDSTYRYIPDVLLSDFDAEPWPGFAVRRVLPPPYVRASWLGAAAEDSNAPSSAGNHLVQPILCRPNCAATSTSQGFLLDAPSLRMMYPSFGAAIDVLIDTVEPPTDNDDVTVLTVEESQWIGASDGTGEWLGYALCPLSAGDDETLSALPGQRTAVLRTFPAYGGTWTVAALLHVWSGIGELLIDDGTRRVLLRCTTTDIQIAQPQGWVSLMALDPYVAYALSSDATYAILVERDATGALVLYINGLRVRPSQTTLQWLESDSDYSEPVVQYAAVGDTENPGLVTWVGTGCGAKRALVEIVRYEVAANDVLDACLITDVAAPGTYAAPLSDLTSYSTAWSPTADWVMNVTLQPPEGAATFAPGSIIVTDGHGSVTLQIGADEVVLIGRSGITTSFNRASAGYALPSSEAQWTVTLLRQNDGRIALRVNGRDAGSIIPEASTIEPTIELRGQADANVVSITYTDQQSTHRHDAVVVYRAQESETQSIALQPELMGWWVLRADSIEHVGIATGGLRESDWLRRPWSIVNSCRERYGPPAEPAHRLWCVTPVSNGIRHAALLAAGQHSYIGRIGLFIIDVDHAPELVLPALRGVALVEPAGAVGRASLPAQLTVLPPSHSNLMARVAVRNVGWTLRFYKDRMLQRPLPSYRGIPVLQATAHRTLYCVAVVKMRGQRPDAVSIVVRVPGNSNEFTFECTPTGSGEYIAEISIPASAIVEDGLCDVTVRTGG